MPKLALDASPSTGGKPAKIHYRDAGAGAAVVVLHGGWGYGYYPFDAQIAELARDRRVIAPDRSGYGASSDVEAVPIDFHARAARETTLVLDALGIERAELWGHSDGAVIATLMALDAPNRFPSVVLEAFHFYRRKPASRDFFATMAEAPERFGARVTDALAREHGSRWRALLARNGRAWLALADGARDATHDLFDGRLPSLSARALFLHGARDPRTEPGELDAVRRALPRATWHVIEGAGHSPHSERANAGEATRAAVEFLREAS